MINIVTDKSINSIITILTIIVFEGKDSCRCTLVESIRQSSFELEGTFSIESNVRLSYIHEGKCSDIYYKGLVVVVLNLKKKNVSVFNITNSDKGNRIER